MRTDPTEIERRAGLLAAAGAAEVRAVAELCIAELGEPTVVTPPETGMVMLQVREPVARERFHLGEVVVTRADVELAGHRGWSVRPGDDRATTLAAAICDAAARQAGASARLVDALCEVTAEAAAAREGQLVRTLQPTIVEFEELD